MSNQGTRHSTALIFAILAAVTVVRHVSSSEEVKLGVLWPYTSGHLQDLDFYTAEHYAAAVSLAVDKVNSDSSLLDGVKLSFVWNDTKCNQTRMVAQQHWQIKQGIVGFIGPRCHGRKAAKVAAKHDLAVVSYGCQDWHVSDKTRYPNFARTNPQHSKAAFKVLEILTANNWKRVTIVYEASRKWHVFKRFLSLQLKSAGIAVKRRVMVDFWDVESSVPEIRNAILSRSKATLFLCSFDITRKIMYLLQKYFEANSDPFESKHGYIAVPLERFIMSNYIKYPFKWFFSAYAASTAERTNTTQRAFSKLQIVGSVPSVETEQYRLFEEEVKKRTGRAPWNSDVYQGCMFKKEDGECLFDKSTAKIPLDSAYLYDAVIQFATALNEVRQAEEKVTGTNIINRLKQKRFTGADGHQHAFDKNADVIYDYTVLRLARDKDNESNMLPVEWKNRT